MSGGILEPAEMEAIQAAIGQSPEPTPKPAPVRPIALIRSQADTTEANQQSSELLKRAALLVGQAFSRSCGLEVEFQPAGVTTVEAEDLRRRMTQVWLRYGEVDGHLPVMVAAGGPMVERVAAHLLGAEEEEEEETDKEVPQDRVPSIAARAIFTRIGLQIAQSLTRAIKLELDYSTAWGDGSNEQERQLLEHPDLLGLRLDIETPFRGTIELYTPPSIFQLNLGRREEEARPRISGEHLADVPVDVSVVLGQCKLTLRELAMLRPGQLLELDRTADDLLPVQCGEVAIGEARPLASEGVIAVRIEAGPRELKGNQ